MEWQLVIMRLKNDCASGEILDFFQRVWSDEVIVKCKNRRGLSLRESVEKSVERSFCDLDGKVLTLYGKGSFHHFTYGLCKVVADRRSKEYCYMHLDHHDDAVLDDLETIGAAGFVNHLKMFTNASSALLLGPDKFEVKVNNPGLKLVKEEELYDAENFRRIISAQPEKDAYLSCDLDVLASDEFSAQWSRGKLRLNHAKDIVRIVNEEKNLVSADILGYIGNDPKSCLVYVVLAGTIFGKDTREAEKLFEYAKKNKVNYDEFLKITEGLKV